ncbi:eukaryotic translation initiation factor 3 subunit H [Octopus bimaculoides]|uniref:Eukaryotic translation initiation factor 3 subunit H n=1 Tax=Octopus bimaculoides TaxID=37653 RepID=A0A0L8H883_OCTBM|nr:eukaryotic translation initiation factor 3 subunit H [Octopus bimaculoides]|eukprot:XP_014774639.1 PREDICTED: eukaryotic translation initiation factor 3 subunit H-like [Octopus bimaculoides]
MATRKSAKESVIDYVQIDGLVVLKLVKHCVDEGSGGADFVQGVLLGLVVDNRLEITNCFPYPRHQEEEELDEFRYQIEIFRNLRHVNIDHLHVGWYQSTYFNSFINRTLVDSQYNYQHSIEESVVLIYDPLKTSQGFLSLKAYRLTDAMMEFYREGEFTPESVNRLKLNFENMFTEIPLVIKNSHLVNVLLYELEQKKNNGENYQFLDLATSSMLEKNLRQLIECVDDVAADTNKYLTFQKHFQRQQQAKQQYLHKRQQEMNARAAKGEPPLPEEDINKLFKPIQPPVRLETMLIAGQIDYYCTQIMDFTSHSFGKLFMADSLQRVNNNLN